MGRLLWICASHARLCLIFGLLAGLLWPRLAYLLQPWLPQMVTVLLLIAALRIGHRAALGAVKDLRWGLSMVVLLQLGVPLLCYVMLSLIGMAETVAGLAIVLVTAAPAITGSINLALLMGQDAGRMMQILVLGTAAFPLTVLPMLALFPQLGDPAVLLRAALMLLGATTIAALAGFGLRRLLFPTPSPDQIRTLDGASVLAFAVIVVALMAPLNGALRSDPWAVAGWTALSFGVSYSLQAGALLLLRLTRLRPVAGPLAIGAGNRNIGLFLVALPTDIIAPILIFVACWQLPMYLTPMLLPRLYRWALSDD